jgi:hypothetical protein
MIFRISGGLINFNIDANAKATAPPFLAPDTRRSGQEWDTYVPIAGLYFSAKNVEGWQISAEGQGTYFIFSEDIVRFYDLSAAISYYAFDNLALFAGYRYQRFNGVNDHGKIDLLLRLSGPMAGVFFRF